MVKVIEAIKFVFIHGVGRHDLNEIEYAKKGLPFADEKFAYR